jgi:CubicO group peptidase (beta-lactamase class C family)
VKSPRQKGRLNLQATVKPVSMGLLFCGLLFPSTAGFRAIAQPPVSPVTSSTAVVDLCPSLDPAKLRLMDAAIDQSLSEKHFPGGVLWVEHGTNAYHKAFGKRALVPQPELMTEDTIFDVASLTKVLATAPCLMRLWEQGKVKLDAPVVQYVPEFQAHGKSNITLRHLLTHTSGLLPGLSRNPDWSGYDKAIALACAQIPTDPPGRLFRYSDINFIVLGEVIQRVSGRPLNEFAAEEIFQPLKMVDTGYLPPASKLSRIAPTERIENEVLRGKVHDPTAQRMGGVAGHAGVFATAADVARFLRMFLNEGELDGVRVFKPDTIRLMTSVQSPVGVDARRGLGWDIDSDYSRPRGNIFPIGSYGHTGFTGVCLWVDPYSRTFWMFFANRVHPDRSGNVLPLQRILANLAAEAVTDFDFAHVPGALEPRATNSPPHL